MPSLTGRVRVSPALPVLPPAWRIGTSNDVANRDAINRSLNELFDAERNVRRVHDELSALPTNELLDALGAALSSALREPNEDEASLRLVRISALLGEHEGPRVLDALIDVLSSDHPEARRAAGEELEALAFERFKEVAGGVERALKRLPVGSPALPELPYILGEVPEPGVVRLLGQFLAHRDADAVAAAIEALAEIGDPQAIKLLEPLVDDTRTVELADDGSEDTSEASLGELASEAIELLGSFEDEAEGDA
jgi:HEAT repeat protein